MEPIAALVLAFAVAKMVTRTGFEAAWDQTRVEARDAAAAIRNNLEERGTDWATRLSERLDGGIEDRLANGRVGGPSRPLWWVWAALRSTQAIHDALTKEPREAEAQRGPTSPQQRIWEAWARGRQFGREEAARQQEARRAAGSRPSGPGAAGAGSTSGQQRKTTWGPSYVRIGVCERCGRVVAATSLQVAKTPGGGTQRMCVLCRNHVSTPTPPNSTTPEPPADVVDVDADVVHEPERAIKAPRPELGAGDPPAPKPQPAPNPPVPPSPPAGAPAAGPAIAPPVVEGEPMTARSPGQIVPVGGGVRPTHGTGTGLAVTGETWTHGQFQDAVDAIRKSLEALPLVLDEMLTRLTAAEAGRAQVKGVLDTRTAIERLMGEVETMLRDVDRRAVPVVAAVAAAGGPEEIAGINYYREV